MKAMVNGDLWDVVHSGNEWHLIVIGGAYRIDLATGVCHGIGVLSGRKLNVSTNAVRRLRKASRTPHPVQERRSSLRPSRV